MIFLPILSALRGQSSEGQPSVKEHSAVLSFDAERTQDERQAAAQDPVLEGAAVALEMMPCADAEDDSPPSTRTFVKRRLSVATGES